MKKIKITLVKRLNRDEIRADSNLGCSARPTSLCPAFVEGQEFIVTTGQPEGFCQGAWADIYRHITVLRWGGHYPWMNEKGKYLACCTDGFRPVVFRLEVLDEEVE